MARNPPESMRDRVAKRLWSGDVAEAPDYGEVAGNLSGATWKGGSQSIAKQDGMRRGLVPQHIEDPVQGSPRPFNPFGLRKLADTETVQACIDTIISDISSIDTLTQPVSEEVDPSDGLMAEIEQALDDLNPNPHSHTKINEMLLRDLLEVGNGCAVMHPQVDGRRCEVIPLDPNSITVDVDEHGILQGFHQYPHAGEGMWGDPVEFDTEEVLWLTLNPETSRMGMYGHSPVEKLQSVISVMGGLVEKEQKDLEEGMPPGIISLVGDNWSESDYSAFETYWENEVKGEQHKLPYTRGEAEFTPFTMSYQEMQVLDRQRWYAKLVGALFGVPISETGLAIGEGINRATDVSQRQKYKQKAVRPLLQLLQDGWTNQYVHRWWSEEVEWQFNPGLDLMEQQELSQIHDRRLKNGTATVNEVREELGKEPVEWGDDPFDLRYYARQKYGGTGTGGLPSLSDSSGGGDSDGGDGGNSDSGPTPEQESRAGLRQDQTPTQSGGQTEVSQRVRSETETETESATGEDDSEAVGKPFAGFSDWGECISTMTGRGHDKESAERICGKLQSEHESKHVEKAWGGEGTWLPAETEGHVPTEKALRENVGDDYTQFGFQPKEIEALHRDLEDEFGRYIEEVVDQLRGRQDLLRSEPPEQPTEKPADSEAVQKGMADYLELLRSTIGIQFAEDVAEILTTHKTRKVLEGQDEILSELEQAGLSLEGITLDDTRERVVQRIQKRSLKVTKPISERLEQDLRDVLEEGWMEGHGITEIERNIEEVTRKWQGTDAERLARDQLGKASKEGRLAYAQETAQEVGGWSKVWISTPDHRTRESHVHMDGATARESEPFEVDYSYDDGPSQVFESYPGESKYGIQCRCDYKLTPTGRVETAKSLSENKTDRMAEIEQQEGRPIHQILLSLEVDPEMSRNRAAEELGLSKRTLYQWLDRAGLK